MDDASCTFRRIDTIKNEKYEVDNLDVNGRIRIISILDNCYIRLLIKIKGNTYIAFMLYFKSHGVAPKVNRNINIIVHNVNYKFIIMIN